MPEAVKVLLVDDQQLVRDGISALLSLQEGVEVVGSLADGKEAIDFMVKNEVDVILMDIRMPEMDGITATNILKQTYPHLRIIMLTTFDDEEYIIRSLQVGACGYLLKDIPTQDLAQAIQLAHSGIFQFSSTAMGKLIDETYIQLASLVPRSNDAFTNLTDREIEILDLVSTGATNKEIADQLFISEGTVKNYVSRILSALGARDRVQAAIYGLKNGLGKNSPHVRNK
jgi:DNA-binding NarL/FixJ family response regulator